MWRFSWQHVLREPWRQGGREAWAAALAFLLTSAVALADFWLPGSPLTPFLSIGPLLAAAGLGAAPAAALTAYAVALALLVELTLAWPPALDGLMDVAAVGMIGALCAMIAARRAQREQSLAQVTRVAEAAQRAVLRPLPEEIGGVRLAARYQSAGEEALIGGDFFDAEHTVHGTRLLVGDVRGKGLEAVWLVVTALTAFRQAAWRHEDLEEVALDLDRAVCQQLGAEDFVTAVLAEFTPGGELRLVNCGHPPPLLLRAGAVEVLEDPGATTPLGLDPNPKAVRWQLAAGDRLLLHTDGLVEARGPDGRYFPLQDRAGRLLAGGALDAALEALMRAVLEHAGGRLNDDLAVILAEPCRPRRRSAPASPIA